MTGKVLAVTIIASADDGHHLETSASRCPLLVT